ncbi:MAG TPA: class IV adenylate cyclase [Candidatus Binataceae bacterium]|nr:class IV adenylate cyclase [Candidatus Binataceae bacterium]
MRNLEAKFALGDLDTARAGALALGYAARASFMQRDTFFAVARGKLKLREQPPGAWLIHYERDRESGLMLSRYEIVPVADPARTREMLARALGVLAEVRKHRTLLTRRNVRLHLDRVETLGGFGEIEAILGEGSEQDAGEGAVSARAAVDELLGALGVGAGELIEVSYFELMARR